MVDMRPTAIKVFTMSHAKDEGAVSDETHPGESQHTATSPPPPPHLDVDAIEPAPPIPEEATKESNCRVTGETTSAANGPGMTSGERAIQPDVARLPKPRAGILKLNPTTTDTTTAGPMTTDTTGNRSVSFAQGVLVQAPPSSMIAPFASREDIERSNAQRPHGPRRAPQGHDIYVPRPRRARVDGETSSESQKDSEQQAQEVSDPEGQELSLTQVPESSDTQVTQSSPRPSPIRRFAIWMKRQAQKPSYSWLFKVCCCGHECCDGPEPNQHIEGEE